MATVTNEAQREALRLLSAGPLEGANHGGLKGATAKALVLRKLARRTGGVVSVYEITKLGVAFLEMERVVAAVIERAPGLRCANPDALEIVNHAAGAGVALFINKDDDRVMPRLCIRRVAPTVAGVVDDGAFVILKNGAEVSRNKDAVAVVDTALAYVPSSMRR